MLEPTPSDLTSDASTGPVGDLEVTITQRAGTVAVLQVSGEIDSLTTAQLDAAVNELLARPAEHFVIDLSDVTFLASGGLAVLIGAAQQAAERDRRLRLVVATRSVRRPLQLTGSDQLFDVFDQLETAVGDPV